ncbi:MAG: polysaccharide biosynthesis protein [Phycisphaerae bacterium]|nr:polysaccharide biosynthesis protein [Phycisphaerae bacterium]
MATTALVIGTPATIRAVERQLAVLPAPPVLVGCVVHQRDAQRYIRDLPVLGDLDELETVCRLSTPGLALVSLPAAMSELIAAVRTRLRKIGVADRFFPTLEDQLAGVGPRTEIDIDLTALIGRPPRTLDERSIERTIRGRTVLVTGAGGSIGSELCRIVAGYGPDRLVMVERSENALFEIDRQIARRWPTLRRHAALQDVVDADATRELFASMRPDVVFHSAAHKHVPLSEDHPGAAIDNNLFGTVSAADASIRCGAERFVMISSDKAVNPTSVMGMTKRLAELYVQHVHVHGQTRGHAAATSDGRACRTGCSMVRFGNVLGSSGSVLETWKRQVRDGGPLTITDPRMTRYFMSIPEAAALVIQSAALHDPTADAGEVFVLNMGEPLRIVDLATRFIEAHGLTPLYPDRVRDARHATGRELPTGSMPVTYTGIRPGEKLFEELALDRESVRPTRHPDIRIWGLPTPEPTAVAAMLHDLAPHRRPKDAKQVVEAIRRHVPEAQVSAYEMQRVA